MFATEVEVWHQIYDHSQYGSIYFSFYKKTTSILCLQDDKQICSLHAVVNTFINYTTIMSLINLIIVYLEYFVE